MIISQYRYPENDVNTHFVYWLQAMLYGIHLPSKYRQNQANMPADDVAPDKYI